MMPDGTCPHGSIYCPDCDEADDVPLGSDGTSDEGMMESNHHGVEQNLREFDGSSNAAD